MADQFDKLVDRVLSHEGNYTANPKDDGNWTGGRQGVGKLKGTKFGISAAAYPNLDIKNLTRAQAIEIYRNDFWLRVQGPKLPEEFAFQALDAAVNSGIGNSVRWMQRAVGVADDGIFGKVTLAAVSKFDPADLVLLFNAERLEFITKTKRFDEFGRGWVNRIAQNLRHAAVDNG